jgi:error-prone DNA polymerase
MRGYAELVAATHFSFLRGASHPDDIIARAHDLDLAGIGIADRNTVAGVVRAHATMRRFREKAAAAGLPAPALKYVPGARLVFVDGTPDIVAYPANRRGWGNLCKLLTQGNLRAEKGDCILRLTDLLTYHDDLLLIVLPTSTTTPQRPRRKLVQFEPDIAEPQLTLVQPPVSSRFCNVSSAPRPAASGSARAWCVRGRTIGASPISRRLPAKPACR